MPKLYRHPQGNFVLRISGKICDALNWKSGDHVSIEILGKDKLKLEKTKDGPGLFGDIGKLEGAKE